MMSNMKKMTALFAALTCLLTAAGCSGQTPVFDSTPETTAASEQTASVTTAAAAQSGIAADALTNMQQVSVELTSADLNTEWGSDAVTLQFSGDSVVASSTDGLTVAEGVVTITKGGDYVLSGTLTDGSVIVDLADDSEKVHLVFNGVQLNCANSAPLTILSADKAIITLADGTDNSLSDGTAYTASDVPEACIGSKCDLTINGSGSLSIAGNCKNGIQCSDDLKLVGGNITVTAVNNGIKGNDSVCLCGSAVTVNADGDGVKSSTADKDGKGFIYMESGELNVNSMQDAIDAATTLTVTGGSITVQSGGGSANAEPHTDEMFGGGFGGNFGGNFDGGNGGFGRGKRSKSESSGQADNTANITLTAAQPAAAETESADTAETSVSKKGLKAGSDITVTGGSIQVNSADDAIHAGGSVTLTGGSLTIAAGDDGIHADEDVTIGTENAGTFDDITVNISEAYEGIEGIHIYQNSGTVYIVSNDDGFNAAGGEFPDGSQGSFMSNSYGEIWLRGGAVCVNSASGDHDGMDSNGPITMTGGYYVCNGMEALDCGEGYSLTHEGGSYITLTAGNTDLTTQYSFVDEAGNVIVSMLSASGSAGQKTDGCTAYSGGTVTGGSELTAQVTAGGKLTGGTEITDEPSEGMMGGFGGGFGGNFGGKGNRGGNGGNMTPPDGFTMPDGFDPADGSFTSPDGFDPADGNFTLPDGMELPDGFTRPEGKNRSGSNKGDDNKGNKQTGGSNAEI